MRSPSIFYVPLNKVFSIIGPVHWNLVLIAPCTKASLAPMLTHLAGLEVSSFVRASLYSHASGWILVTSLLNKVLSIIGSLYFSTHRTVHKRLLGSHADASSGARNFVRASLYFHTSRGILVTSLRLNK